MHCIMYHVTNCNTISCKNQSDPSRTHFRFHQELPSFLVVVVHTWMYEWRSARYSFKKRRWVQTKLFWLLYATCISNQFLSPGKNQANWASLTFTKHSRPLPIPTWTWKFEWKSSSSSFPTRKAQFEPLGLQPARSVSWGGGRLTRRWLQSILDRRPTNYHHLPKLHV